MTMARLVRLGAIVAAGALLLAGCSSSDGNEPDKTADAQATGPLEEFFKDVTNYQQYNDEYFKAQDRKVGEIITACMAEQGFEYVHPVDSGALVVSSTDGPQYGSKEYVEKYGYGITTQLEDSTSEPEPEVSSQTDPNDAYVAAMSAGEQKAYYEALYGAQEEVASESDVETGTTDAVEWDWTKAGCSGKAQHEVYGEMDEVWQDPQFKDLQDAMVTLYDSTASDARMTELNSQWADCMADAGHTGLATPQDAMDSINTKYSKLWEDLQSSDGTEGSDGSTDTSAEDGSDGEVAVPSIDPSSYPTLDPAAVKALQAEEMSLAGADYTCRDKLNYDKKSQDIQFDLERKFIDSHQAELDAMKQALAEQQKSQSAKATAQ